MPRCARNAPRLGLAARLSLLVLAATGLIFSSAFLYNYFVSKDILLASAREGAINLAKASRAKFEELLESVEPAAELTARSFANAGPGHLDPLAVMRELAEASPNLFGVCAALEPGAAGNERAFVPYLSKKDGTVSFEDLAKPGYDFSVMDWYLIPKTLGRPVWSEPYFDEGGGDIVMSTYSTPICRGAGSERKCIGVATADISLDWLQREVSRISIHHSGFAFLISRTGTIVAHPNKAWIMRESIFSLAESLGDPGLREIGRAMIRGETGFTPLSPKFMNKPAYVAFTPLPANGWSVGVVVPEAELFADLNKLHRRVTMIGAAGFAALLAIIVVISAGIARPIALLARKTAAIARGDLDVELPAPGRNDEVGDLTRAFEDMRGALKEYIANLTAATKAKERMESELKIAKSIQMSFLPKRFPPFPETNAFTLHAALEPAREVGGDLYDFFLLDPGRLFFSIGDVSGKGVPAALFMAVTKTLIKGVSEHAPGPEAVLSKVNLELCKENEAMLFVTIFCAVLDCGTGRLTYSNAGHCPPVLIRSGGDISFLPLPEGLVLGVMEEASYAAMSVTLAPGDTLVVYTDGVTEAQNSAQELYANERFLSLLQAVRERTPDAIDAAIMAGVTAFTGEAEQYDDITVLTLRYNGPGRLGAA